MASRSIHGGPLGVHIVQRPHAEGTEDHVVFEEKPALEELRYQVDLTRVAGLRLVTIRWNFWTARGLQDSHCAADRGRFSGRTHDATLAVTGCNVDTDPRGPWGRAVTGAGASACVVRVSWRGVSYPALVDPSWTSTGAMATARSGHTATLLASGNVLVAGGGNAQSEHSSAELYNPAGGGTFAATGSMADSRIEHTATLLPSGKVLMAGGFLDGGSRSSAELSSRGHRHVQSTGSLAASRYQHTATLLASGKVFVAGGNQNDQALSSAELYDPAGSGTFSTAGTMSAARRPQTATLLPSGKVLLAGGYGPPNRPPVPNAELYDPAGAGTFIGTGPMAVARNGHSATLLPSGKVLLAGGTSTTGGTHLSTAELSTPPAPVLSPPPPQCPPRRYHSATLLPSGKVLVAGGYDDGGSAPSAPCKRRAIRFCGRWDLHLHGLTGRGAGPAPRHALAIWQGARRRRSNSTAKWKLHYSVERRALRNRTHGWSVRCPRRLPIGFLRGWRLLQLGMCRQMRSMYGRPERSRG